MNEIKLEKRPLEEMIHNLIFDVSLLKVRLDKLEKLVVG